MEPRPRFMFPQLDEPGGKFVSFAFPSLLGLGMSEIAHSNPTAIVKLTHHLVFENSPIGRHRRTARK